MIDLDNTVSQRQFADVIGVSEAAVSGFVKRCVIVEGHSLGAWIIDYCSNLREQAAGRAASGDLDLATERARLAKEQADKVALQNAVTRGELAPAALIEEVLTKAAARISGIFDAIPAKVRRRFPDLPAETIEAISAEVGKARNAVANLSLDSIDDDVQPSSDDAVIEV